jgi:hypothetical protein
MEHALWRAQKVRHVISTDVTYYTLQTNLKSVLDPFNENEALSLQILC